MSDLTPEEYDALTPEQKRLVDDFDAQPDPADVEETDNRFGDLPYDDLIELADDGRSHPVDLDRARAALRSVRPGDTLDPDLIRKSMED